ncbi:hypothetical protein CEUSTIGMA_g2326.t1 [Chlamydomonas eustigma]|uniref:Uncharacterized protein n=1 Tax=Chlamydomonas eustigma TaxID=1157962 RepID=A0A250WWH2_9CHLO|nr:hypothetical protein CEUSTIGMA_g2326.t1 [Chlamydomonas eustigma]|eukprot:GAX74880.1 hypothetical protein CEUSTIGMA_g2326.t1 [Chlamydomonas eustigma]
MPPKKQFTITSTYTALATLGLPLSVGSVIFGIIGLSVITDNEGTGIFTNSPLGTLIHNMTHVNYLSVAMVLNCGLVGVVACIAYLVEWNTERKLRTERPRIASKKDQ